MAGRCFGSTFQIAIRQSVAGCTTGMKPDIVGATFAVDRGESACLSRAIPSKYSSMQQLLASLQTYTAGMKTFFSRSLWVFGE